MNKKVRPSNESEIKIINNRLKKGNLDDYILAVNRYLYPIVSDSIIIEYKPSKLTYIQDNLFGRFYAFNSTLDVLKTDHSKDYNQLDDTENFKKMIKYFSQIAIDGLRTDLMEDNLDFYKYLRNNKVNLDTICFGYGDAYNLFISKSNNNEDAHFVKRYDTVSFLPSRIIDYDEKSIKVDGYGEFSVTKLPSKKMENMLKDIDRLRINISGPVVYLELCKYKFKKKY